MNILQKQTLEFRQKLQELSREELLEIIAAQNPDLITGINRIEWVFANRLRHLTWKNGQPITGRPMTKEELILLIDEPFRYSEELARLGMNAEQQKNLHIAKDPVVWSRAFLKDLKGRSFKPRVYQILMLRDTNQYKVLRAGRRLGKTTTMAVMALHYSYTTTGGKTIVVTPMLTQAKLIFDEIVKWAQTSDLVKESIERKVLNPQAEIEFSNNSTIRFFTSGMKSGGKSDITRGQEAHLIILDELDYMGDEDLEALLAMMQQTDEDTVDKRMVGASTPSGKQAVFWRWCTDPDSDFKEFWFPSYVNPYWRKSTEDFLRKEHGANGFRREVEADWGEPVDGVYPKRYLDRAFVWDKDPDGRDTPAWEYLATKEHMYSTYVMGVDWDKHGAGVNIVVLEYFNSQLSPPEWRNRIRVCFREETGRDDYTLTKAVNRIVELHETFRFKHIYVDRGYGETQYELLRQHGVNFPSSGLHKVVKGFTFSDAIEVRDPFTMQKIKKEIKPFMVDNLRQFLERDQIVFPGQDEELKMSLINYVVARHTSAGREVYEMTGGSADHAHDALILACLAITQNYGDLMRTNYATQSHAVSNEVFLQIARSAESSSGFSDPFEPSDNKDQTKTKPSPAPISRSMSYTSRSRSRSKPIRRKSF